LSDITFSDLFNNKNWYC